MHRGTMQTRTCCSLLLVSALSLLANSETRHQDKPPQSDHSTEEIQKQVDMAIRTLQRNGFFPWPREQIDQMVPRLHLGVLELWLEFRHFQRENQQMWKRIKGLMAQDATCCQGLALEISNFKNEVLQKTQTLEGEMVVLQGKVGDLEETEETDRTVENTESNETTDMPALPAVTPSSQSEMVNTRVDQSGDTHVINNASDPVEVGVGLPEPEMKSCHSEVSANPNSLDKLRQRVSDLTQLLNGHTELLVELYERLSALEGHELDQRPSEYEGSGDHQ
ncbi:hypothetical protein AOXY_G18008 [Acipenser oxyrinchus oxyrinchus]|uniref:Uncharacterized protein n=1 Tax=Acipenser oxyrinchus oxyrinchus TaxID=40147 RepID=A0AAD8D5J1_ACIOX|nr:hypothetical protein AOXY_G18008 [Acipenser oxyrinchus oxyrinchus]